MKIYTRTGDKGTTSHCTFGRVLKCSPEIEVSGAFDNALSALGFAREEVLACANRSESGAQDSWEKLADQLAHIQSRLFNAATCLFEPSATSAPLGESDVEELEALIDDIDDKLPALDCFILPGGSEANARFNLARCRVRDLERIALSACQAHEGEAEVSGAVLAYINRLSDALFVMGRYALALEGKEPTKWQA